MFILGAARSRSTPFYLCIGYLLRWKAVLLGRLSPFLFAFRSIGALSLSARSLSEPKPIRFIAENRGVCFGKNLSEYPHIPSIFRLASTPDFLAINCTAPLDEESCLWIWVTRGAGKCRLAKVSGARRRGNSPSTAYWFGLA